MLRPSLFLGALAACAAGRDPAPVGNRTAGGPASAPEIVELPARSEDDPPADVECAADPPRHGIVDRTSTRFSRIEVRKGRYAIEERAWYRPGGADEVTVTTGGCAHYGTRYRFVFAAARPATQTAHHLDRAVELLVALPITSGVEHDFRDRIVTQPRARTDQACSYSDSETGTVFCAVEQAGAGRVAVELGYDISL